MYFRLLFCSFAEIGVEPRALPMLGKYSSTGLPSKHHVSFEVPGSSEKLMSPGAGVWHHL